MILRPAHDDEQTYVRETTLKLLQPGGIGYRRWEQQTARWVASLSATVLADDPLIVGFVLEAPNGVYVLYVRRKFRGVGFGAELMQGRVKALGAAGFGPWSDLGLPGPAQQG